MDKIKKHLRELIQKYFGGLCIPYFCNIKNNPQIKHILPSLGYLPGVEIFFSIIQPDIRALYNSNLNKYGGKFTSERMQQILLI